jgi:HK97 gp10 family phage protein
MGKVTFDVNGKKELATKFEKLSNRVKKEVAKSVRKRTYQIETRAKEDAPYDTGNLERNVKSYFFNGGLSGEVYSHAKYSIYQELGTRYMSAQPFFFHNYVVARKDFTNDLERILEELEL